MSVVGYVPGGFDLFHIGHLNILRAAAQRCDILVAGVATDESLFQMKNRRPVIPLVERMAIVQAIECVDRAVPDYSIDKRVAFDQVHFDVLFKGDDWQGTAKGAHLESQMAQVGARVEYFPYTSWTSSTALRKYLTTDTLAASA